MAFTEGASMALLIRPTFMEPTQPTQELVVKELDSFELKFTQRLSISGEIRLKP